jgi:hypothetical protein
MLVFDRAGVEGGSLSQVWTMHNMLLVSIFFVTTYVVCVDSELHVSNALARCDSKKVLDENGETFVSPWEIHGICRLIADEILAARIIANLGAAPQRSPRLYY